MAEPTDRPNPRGLRNSRRGQYLVIGAVVVLVWLLFVVLLSGAKKKTQRQQSAVDAGKVAVQSITAPGAAVTDAQRWLYEAGDEVTLLKGQVRDTEHENRSLQSRVAKLEEKLQHMPLGRASAPAAGPAVYPPGNPGLLATDRGSASGSDGSGRRVGKTPLFVPPPSVKESAVRKPEPPRPPAPVPEIGRVSIAPDAGSRSTRPYGRRSNQGSGTKAKVQHEAGVNYLPIGFVKARLLGGLDAPTSGSGQSNPLPVFFHVMDPAWLPNHWRANLKDCMVTAAAYGDLSSERALFRLEKLSCIRRDGRVIEKKVSGTVYGEDGKVGMRGRLVSKQGQILANALLAGIVSGIGRGIVYQTSSTGVTALGTTVTQANPGDEFQSGIAQGVNSAMNRLAQYYIKLADKMFPVIEIDAQRTADLAFTSGTALDTPLPDAAPDLLTVRRGSDD